ncbi:MAG: PTS sugar transporter subunit IIA [Endomicrobium sp.]|jgi:PTS system nitrogen regulatory IIA component|nr:PTS sugar transporter subunit IIA [Endomicrobium sp.]
MKIMDFLNQDAIILDLTSQDKSSTINELVSLIKLDNSATSEIVNIILAREKLGSTGIGQGIAIPHGKTNILTKQTGILGISHKGIEFNSLDGELVYIVFVLIGPVDETVEHLNALSKISKLVKDKCIRTAIKLAKTKDEIITLINKEDSY